MSWKCRLIDPKSSEERLPGDMWFVNRAYWEHDPESLRHKTLIASPEYFRDTFAKRPPLCVILPSGDWFYVDGCASGTGHGWTVTGDPPNITVSPSINAVGSYHGWLQNGVLSDDCEGRTFPS